MAQSSIAPVDFKILFEKSFGLFLVLDRDLRAVAATDAYCARIRLPRETLVGLSLEELFPGHRTNPGADSFARLKASLERVLATKRPDTMGTQRYDIPRPQSEGGGYVERYWSPRNSPVLDGTGEVRWIIHRVYDVTDAVLHPEEDAARRRLAANQERLILELQRNNEELAQLDALRAQLLTMSRSSTVAALASALAHDVSQPLTAARNYVSAVRRGRAAGRDGGDLDELLGKIAQQIERAGEIVRSLRTFMATGNSVRAAEYVEDVARDAALLAGPALKAAGATLAVDVEAGLAPVPMDRVQIQQAIVNLLVNAAESVTGCPERAIALSVCRVEGTVHISVADTGVSLPLELVRQYFEPFATANLAGPGLGLAVAHQIVTEHQGAIAVEANAPSGTIFTVTLPFAAAAANADSL
jgi:C4-dicarboxylate-specific signal transduction histidine kinase